MIFNGHSDILADINIRRLQGEKEVFRRYHYENFLKSGVKSVILVIWNDLGQMDNPKKRVDEIIQSMLEEFEEASDILNVVKKYEDFDKGIKENKINVLIGMEGLAHIEDNLDLLQKYYMDINLRHASLTWNEKNMLASGASNDEGGLTRIGQKAVEKIEELGILLDVSHLNEKSFWDIAEIATRPFIASHSNAKALADVKRNLDDNQLIAIAKSGGLVGVNAVGEFINADLDKRKIELPDAIRSLGYTKVPVKLHPEVNATLTVHVKEAN